MHKYHLEFTLDMDSFSLEPLRNSLLEFGENLEICPLTPDNPKAKDFQVRISTEDPTFVFDTCAQFGRLKSVKIKES